MSLVIGPGDALGEPARAPREPGPVIRFRTGSPVAVCTLTSRALVPLLAPLPQAAVVGTLMTANLGIEALVKGLLERPAITSLVVCGRDSPRFHAGQSLVALFRYGMDADSRAIIGARGYLPVLRSLQPADVEAVRANVRLVDARGLEDPRVLSRLVARAADPDGRPDQAGALPRRPGSPQFERISPGGRRDGLHERNEGFVVITVERREKQISLHSFGPDLSPRHEMRGHRAESMLLGLLRAGVVREASHAGYLGAELAKAETALRLGLPYEQDLPLRDRTTGERGTTVSDTRDVLQLEDLMALVKQTLGVDPSVPVDPEVALGEQLMIESARMIELTITLEDDLGLALPDDVDLRQETVAGLYRQLPEQPAA